ncbi:MAG: divalent-cation tolerance protein CutA [Polyangiales bacterium]
MSAEDQLIVILCTVPDQDTAQRLATGLVEERLAACVNVLPGVRSFYRWKGKIEHGSELQLLIKTPALRFDELVSWLENAHPYEVPEIVAITAQRVNAAFLAWAIEQTS